MPKKIAHQAAQFCAWCAGRLSVANPWFIACDRKRAEPCCSEECAELLHQRVCPCDKALLFARTEPSK